MRDCYRDLCDAEESIPLFCQAWWLDAVCGENNWDAAVVKRGDEIHAALPYYMPSTWIVGMPKLTQHMGPWLRPGQGGYGKELSRQMQLTTELIAQLPPFKTFQQNFHYSVTNWLPYYWKGYTQTTRYTYVLDDLSDLDALWKGLSGSKSRTPIRKAKKLGIGIVDNLGVAQLQKIHDATFERQQKVNPIPFELLESVHAATTSRNSGKMLFAVDENEKVHAAAFVVWTPQSAYYLMGGADPQLRSSGAQSLVLWEAIRFAASVSSKFDFEGSMIEPVERVFRNFGGKQKPFFTVRKDNRKMTEKGLRMAVKMVKGGAARLGIKR